ncbi:MAG TPA: hypothetical protein VJQ57_05660 [Acidimicrobiia bacterium]|nr:hypothetical protein [Acidimicrobiia bacterium]
MIARIEAELAGDPFVVVTKQRGGLLMTKTDEPTSKTYLGRRRRFGPAAAAVVVVIAATLGFYLAMAGNADQPVVDQGPVAPATTTVSPSPSSTAAPDAAPPELAGRWVTEVNGERVMLSFSGTNYAWQFVGGQGVGGKISVEGNRIRFYSAPVPGDGFYEWTIDDDTLTFTELEPADVVSERQGQLTNFVFRRP